MVSNDSNNLGGSKGYRLIFEKGLIIRARPKRTCSLSNSDSKRAVTLILNRHSISDAVKKW